MAEAKTKAGTPKGFPGDADYDPGNAGELEARFLALAEDPTTVVDPRQVQRDIAARILGAEDFDAALDMADAGALSLEDLAETPFYIDGISWHKSAPAFAEGGLGVFALLTLTVLGGPLKGQTVALTAGGTNVLSTLYKGVQAGAVPDLGQEKRREFRFKPAGTAAGFTTYWLARA